MAIIHVQFVIKEADERLFLTDYNGQMKEEIKEKS